MTRISVYFSVSSAAMIASRWNKVCGNVSHPRPYCIIYVQTNFHSEFYLNWTCSRLRNGIYRMRDHARQTTLNYLQAVCISKHATCYMDSMLMILVPRELPFHALCIVVNAWDILIFARYRYRRRITHKDHHAVDKRQKDYLQDDTIISAYKMFSTGTF